MSTYPFNTTTFPIASKKILGGKKVGDNVVFPGTNFPTIGTTPQRGILHMVDGNSLVEIIPLAEKATDRSALAQAVADALTDEGYAVDQSNGIAGLATANNNV